MNGEMYILHIHTYIYIYIYIYTHTHTQRVKNLIIDLSKSVGSNCGHKITL